MDLILPARTLDSSYEIDNSLRFNANNDRLERTPSSTGSRRKFTLSTWVKFNSGARRNIMAWKTDSNNAGEIRVEASGQVQAFEFQGGTQSNGFGLYSTRLLRDPSAWYNLFISIDTTQGTSGLIMYINGQEITYDTRTLGGGTNLDCNFNLSGTPMKIGSDRDDGQVWDGYIAEMHWIDGTIKSPTDFGETNSNGVWVPKKYTGGSYSTNGFFFEFQQTGTGTNSSGMGADTSGQDNHFAVTNLTATDQTTDTPTNNFATLNPLANATVAGGTFSEGNVKFVTNQADYSFRPSTIGVSAGKWYCEIKAVSFGGGADPFMIGITSSQPTANSHELGHFANDWGYKEDQKYRNNNSNTTYGDSYTSGDIIGIALDLTNNKLYFSKNGTWQNSGDPTSGSTGTGAISITAVGSTPLGNYFFAIGDYDNSSGSTSTFEANFGNPSFSISSGNSDSEGFGNFEYAVPSGYFALCTKNLAEYG